MNFQVSVYGMAEMSDEEAKTALKEAVRVLKPGKVQYFHFPTISFDLEVLWVT